jgi:anti-anti-sigma regulatory factor
MHIRIRREGGQLEMINLHQQIHELLKITSLHKVFDICEDEASALQSFGLVSRANG